jgi:glycosyltransferase involved in cell wall biosynthesis
MKISVVIPAYNHARWLPESIESALQQTLQPHEIIVVDDGSTDNTREVVARYPVKYIYLAQVGPSAARNHGIREAVGDWIAFLDADDRWLPRKLELQAAAVRDEGFCYCATTLFHEDGQTAPRQFYDARHVKTVLRRQNCIDTSSVLIRKDLLIRIGGFNETIRAGEDWEVWLKLAQLTGFAAVPGRLLLYRVTGTGLSADPQIVLRSMDALVAAGTGGLPPIRRFVAARRMRSVRTALAALKYRDAGDYRNTLRYAWQAFAWWPSPFYDRAFKILLLELGRRVRHFGWRNPAPRFR